MKQNLFVIAFLLFVLSVSSVFAAGDLTQKIHPALREKRSGMVPVIVQYDDSIVLGKNELQGFGCEPGKILKSLHGIAARCPAEALKALADDDSAVYVWEDELLALALDASVPLINATIAWNDFGNGTGINVSIIDSGINNSHSGLAGQVVLENDFTPEGILDDRCNHGTPVACIVGCIDNTYRGVAPGIKMFNAKVARVLNENPLQCGVMSSDAIAAIDWSVEHGAQVIQLSVGSGVSSCYQSALAVAVNNTGKNITIVVPAGNGGPGNQSVWTPGCAENALTVGASNGDSVEDYSSRGPTDYGLSKPDVVAPGTGITAADSSGNGFSDHTGTSFASPHAAGVVALMLQQKNLLPFEVKQILGMTSIDLGYSENIQGAGRVDAWAAVNMSEAWVGSPFLETAVVVPETATGLVFVINATISNTGSADAENVSAVLAVPESLAIIGSAERNVGLISAGSSASVNWTVNSSLSGTYDANITTSAAGVGEDVVSFTIIVDPVTFGLVMQPDSAGGKDSYVASGRNDDNNYGSGTLMQVQYDSLRALVEWDLGQVPQGATIVNAIMQFYVPSVKKNNGVAISAYRLTQSWTESGVTWNSYDGTNNWVSAGGDYDAFVWASQTIGAPGQYYDWNITGLASAWHTGTYVNNGLLLISDASIRKDLSSSDSLTASRRPALLVNYTL